MNHLQIHRISTVEGIGLWFFLMMEICEKVHKIFTYAFITLLPKLKRENFIINQANVKKVRFWWF